MFDKQQQRLPAACALGHECNLTAKHHRQQPHKKIWSLSAKFPSDDSQPTGGKDLCSHCIPRDPSDTSEFPYIYV